MYSRSSLIGSRSSVYSATQSPRWPSENVAVPLNACKPYKCGGVSILSGTATPFKLTTKVFHHFAQLIAGYVNGLPLVAFVGDLNARKVEQDDKTNTEGLALSKWTRRHNFYVSRPPRPILSNNTENSMVDVILQRGPTLPSISVMASTTHSDHSLVLAKVIIQATKQPLPPTLSVMPNQYCYHRARSIYRKTLPVFIRALEQCSSPGSLNINPRHLAEQMLSPWLDIAPPRPGIFRQGCPIALEGKPKQRTWLLLSLWMMHKSEAKKIEREIKQEFRWNFADLQHRIGDEISSSLPNL